MVNVQVFIVRIVKQTRVIFPKYIIECLVYGIPQYSRVVSGYE